MLIETVYEHDMMTDENAQSYVHRATIEAIANALPDNVIKQALDYLPHDELFLIVTSCRSLSHLAKAAMYSHLTLERRSRVDRLMACYPDPDEIAGYIEILEVPGALDASVRQYIDRLISRASNLVRFKVGLRDSKDPAVDYFPAIPKNHQIRILTVGEHSSRPIAIDSPMIPLSGLSPFSNVTELHWDPVDRRLGTLQSILGTINDLCPYVKWLGVPWTDRFDAAIPWDYMTTGQHLKHLTFRFDHESRITLPAFVKCLHELYRRGISVQVGSGCAMETVHWLQGMYAQICHHEVAFARPPEEMLRWVIQTNRKHLLKLTDIPRNSPMLQAMYRAIPMVDCSDGWGFRIQSDFRNTEIPSILLQNLRYLRMQVNRENVDPSKIPTILRANTRLRAIIVAMHISNYSSNYQGNCTYNKIPLLPGHSPRFTTPPFELVYRVKRNEGGLTQQWKAYSRGRRGPPPTATELPKLNVFNLQNWKEPIWSDELKTRLSKWEDEVKSWFELCPSVNMVAMILNTDVDKFGRLERYWCTCHE